MIASSASRLDESILLGVPGAETAMQHSLRSWFCVAAGAMMSLTDADNRVIINVGGRRTGVNNLPEVVTSSSSTWVAFAMRLASVNNLPKVAMSSSSTWAADVQV